MSLKSTVASVFMVLSCGQLAAEESNLNCTQPLEIIGVKVNQYGVTLVGMYDDKPLEFMIDGAELPENTVWLDSLVDEGIVSVGQADQLRHKALHFDEIEEWRDQMIQQDPNFSMVFSNNNKYVLYGDIKGENWQTVMAEVMNSYGTGVSDPINIIANTIFTVQYDLSLVESACSVVSASKEQLSPQLP